MIILPKTWFMMSAQKGACCIQKDVGVSVEKV